MRTAAVWAFILVLPVKQIRWIIDEAIRGTPGFASMSIPDQDRAIADWLCVQARTYRRR